GNTNFRSTSQIRIGGYMSRKIGSSLTLRLRIETKGPLSTEVIDSFSRLGFKEENGIPKRWESNPRVFTHAQVNSLNSNDFLQLSKLLISLSPITLSLSFNGSNDSDTTSQALSYTIQCSGNTFVSGIDKVLKTLTQCYDATAFLASAVSSPPSFKAESVQVRSTNGGW